MLTLGLMVRMIAESLCGDLRTDGAHANTTVFVAGCMHMVEG